MKEVEVVEKVKQELTGEVRLVGVQYFAHASGDYRIFTGVDAAGQVWYMEAIGNKTWTEWRKLSMKIEEKS